MDVPKNVVNKKLYLQVKNEIKSRVKVWPSAYASGQLVKEYKKRGGKYYNEDNGLLRRDEGLLRRWYDEEWINVCERNSDGTFKKCGRKQSTQKNYPYCRPLKRITKDTPMTVGEIIKKYGDQKLKELCKQKRKEGLPLKGKPKQIKQKFKIKST